MVNQKICDDILRYGEIKEDKEFECDGDHIRQYVIRYNGINYALTKANGEWVYFTIA